MGSITERERLKLYYAAADLFLFPSLYDNAPLVVREAAALHTPSLLIKGSTSAEVIHDSVNGFLSDNSVTAYASRISQLLETPQLIAGSRRGGFTQYSPLMGRCGRRGIRSVC